MPNEVKLLPCENRDFVDRLKTDPQNVANQLLALTSISDWARVQHRDNFDGYLIAAAELLTRPTTVVTDEVVERVARALRLHRWRSKAWPTSKEPDPERFVFLPCDLAEARAALASMPTVVTGEQPLQSEGDHALPPSGLSQSSLSQASPAAAIARKGDA